MMIPKLTTHSQLLKRNMVTTLPMCKLNDSASKRTNEQRNDRYIQKGIVKEYMHNTTTTSIMIIGVSSIDL